MRNEPCGQHQIYEVDTMTNTTKKLTKRDHFTTLLTLSEVQADPALVDFINHELELLAKKNSAEKKQTPVQIANDGIKDAIYEGMAENRLYSVTELIKEIPACADLTNQRVSALLRQMMPERVERVEEKRKAYFRKVC